MDLQSFTNLGQRLSLTGIKYNTPNNKSNTTMAPKITFDFFIIYYTRFLFWENPVTYIRFEKVVVNLLPISLFVVLALTKRIDIRALFLIYNCV